MLQEFGYFYEQTCRNIVAKNHLEQQNIRKFFILDVTASTGILKVRLQILVHSYVPLQLKTRLKKYRYVL